MSSLFTHVASDMGNLLQRYAMKQKAMSIRKLKVEETDRRPYEQPTRQVTELHSNTLNGRTELSVLMEELWAAPRIKSEFTSPLDMILSFVQRADHHARLDFQ